MSFTSYNFTVSEQNDGQSLRTFLRRECGISARSLTLLKYSDMGISRNGEEVRARDRLRQGDIISLTLPPDTNEIPPVPGELDILYEDEYILIVNKPPYMPVHPTKVHQMDTLANIVSYYQMNKGEHYAFRALNRLDKDTSGCVIIAKDRISYALVKDSIKKCYVAVCEGIIKDGGVIDEPIALEEGSKIKRCVCTDGAAAVTYYEPISYGNGHTMVELSLETGRTHQIRCHMSHIGHPLAGDDLYGGSMEHIQRQALHCKTVSLLLPVTKERITVDTDIPSEFLHIIKEGM